MKVGGRFGDLWSSGEEGHGEIMESLFMVVSVVHRLFGDEWMGVGRHEHGRSHA